MGQRLRTFVALAYDPDSVLSTHLLAHKHPYDPGDLTSSSDLHMIHVHTGR